MDWPGIVATLVTAAIAATPGILALRKDAAKSAAEAERADAEADKLRHEIETALRDELRGDIIALRARVTEQDSVIAELQAVIERMRQREAAHMAGIRRLIKQLADHQIAPIWQPEEK